MNTYKEEFYRVYNKCIKLGFESNKAEEVAKLHIENLQQVRVKRF